MARERRPKPTPDTKAVAWRVPFVNSDRTFSSCWYRLTCRLSTCEDSCRTTNIHAGEPCYPGDSCLWRRE